VAANAGSPYCGDAGRPWPGVAALFVRPLNLVQAEQQSPFRFPTIKMTIWVSVLCLLPTLALWGSPRFTLPYYLYPIPCLVADALGVLSWPYSPVWVAACLACQVPAYAALLRLCRIRRSLVMCSLALICVHLATAAICLSTRPLSYHGPA
jgi:hypothetical protein